MTRWQKWFNKSFWSESFWLSWKPFSRFPFQSVIARNEDIRAKRTERKLISSNYLKTQW